MNDVRAYQSSNNMYMVQFLNRDIVTPEIKTFMDSISHKGSHYIVDNLHYWEIYKKSIVALTSLLKTHFNLKVVLGEE